MKEFSPVNWLIPESLTHEITCAARVRLNAKAVVDSFPSQVDDAITAKTSSGVPLCNIRSQPATGRIAQKRAEDQAAGPTLPGAGHAVGAPRGDGDPGRTATETLASRHVR